MRVGPAGPEIGMRQWKNVAPAAEFETYCGSAYRLFWDRSRLHRGGVLELTYTNHSMAPFARDLGYDGLPFPWNEDRRALLRAEFDAWYARAYGLTLDELR